MSKAHYDAKVADKLGIMRVKPDVAEEQLVLAWRTRMPVCLIGPTGQGKSATVSSAAHKLRQLALMNQLDWRVPTSIHSWKVLETYEEVYKQVYEKGLKSSDVGFELLTTNPSTKDAYDYTGLAKVNDETGIQSYYRPSSVPSDMMMLGIWQITEMNRPAAKRAIRPLLDVFQSRIIDEHVLPPGISIVADFNEGDLYDTEEIMDPFFIRRASFIYVENDYASWRNWMVKRQIGDLVYSFLDTKPNLFDNDKARHELEVYACAATWTRVQEIINVLGPHAPVHKYLPLLAGMLRQEVAVSLVEFIRKGTKLNPSKILEDYSKVRSTVEELLNSGGGIDYIPAAAHAALEALVSMDPQNDRTHQSAVNFAKFYADLPLEIAQSIGSSILIKNGGAVLPSSGETTALSIVQNELMAYAPSRAKMRELMGVISEDGAPKVLGALGAYSQGKTAASR